MWQCLAAIGPATLASTHFPGGSLFGRNPGQNSPCTHAGMPEAVQNSPCTHAGMPEAVQNSPCAHAGMPEPVQNSPSTHADMPKALQNSPCTHADMPKALQNSPSTAKIAHFGPFSACRAKIVTLPARNNRSRATCGAPPAAYSSHGARPPHGDHLFGPRKADAGAHTALISTMSRDDWDSEKEISPLLGIAPADMKN